MRLSNALSVLLFAIFLQACNNNLIPSSEDLRTSVQPGSTGNKPTQVLADFTLKDIDGIDRSLSEFLDNGSKASDAVVIYFTMWCSSCLAHSDHLSNSIIPNYMDKGNVTYILIDYVSQDVTVSEATAQANGLATGDFVILVDDGSVRKQLEGNMAIILVVGSDGTVYMNHTFGSDEQLEQALDDALAN